MSLPWNVKREEAVTCKRTYPRYSVNFRCNWDFFSVTKGLKSGHVENISLSGCCLRTQDLIDHRRWVRLVIKSESGKIWLTTLGRIIRRQDVMEAWNGEIVLYRFGVQFVNPLNHEAFGLLIPGTPCSNCSSEPTTIPDAGSPLRAYCLRCHIRTSCRRLLTHS